MVELTPRRKPEREPVMPRGPKRVKKPRRRASSPTTPSTRAPSKHPSPSSRELEDFLNVQERFEEIFRCSKDAIGISTLDGRLVEVNEAFERLTGYAREDLLGGRTYQDLTPREYHASDGHHVSRLLTTGEPVQYEQQLYRREGGCVPVLVSLFTVQGSDGKPMGIARMIMDLSEHKQAEAQLKESEERFRLVIDHASDAMFFVDPNGVIQWANRQMEVLTCHVMYDLVHHPLESAFSSLPVVQTAVASMLRETRGPQLMELDFLGLNETPVWLEVSSTSVQKEGREVGRLFVIRDIRERKQIETQLRQMEKMDSLSTLLSGVAHEINNPLFILSGHIQLAREKIRHGMHESLAQDLVVMQETAQRTSDLVRRFLNVARLGEGRREQCNLNVLAQKVLELAENDFKADKIEIRTDFAEDLPLVWTNPHELCQVFLNLMANARQAMARDHGYGVLTVASRPISHPDKPMVEISLADTGPGIPAHNIARIFDPFFTTKPTGQGTGLGLAISHRIVTELKGTLTCESILGKGTTFMVRLPIQPRSQSERRGP